MSSTKARAPLSADDWCEHRDRLWPLSELLEVTRVHTGETLLICRPGPGRLIDAAVASVLAYEAMATAPASQASSKPAFAWG